MGDYLANHPGLWFVAATFLPLLSFVILLLAGFLRWSLRSCKPGSPGNSIFNLLGGEVTGRGPAFVATAAIALAFVCSLIGGVKFLTEDHHAAHASHAAHHHAEGDKHHDDDKEAKNKEAEGKEAEGKNAGKDAKKSEEKKKKGDDPVIIEPLQSDDAGSAEIHQRWADNMIWAKIGPIAGNSDSAHATELRIGYYIDHLTVTMFLMVTFIATLIHIFSMGYMSEELDKTVEDHHVHTEHGHFHRRGRFGRFFLFLSLFCFSMLNLLLADNLFQIFVSWELVGVCSFLLIGFYYERTSASNAANKAFITNRVGDAGFIIGVLILWTYVGTLNFQEIFQRLRAPEQMAGEVHSQWGKIIKGGNYYRGQWSNERIYQVLNDEGSADVAIIFPRHLEAAEFRPIPGHVTRGRRDPSGTGMLVVTKSNPGPNDFGAMPYWMLVVAGLGIFLGCVGKSAQFPLHVWLPDAMEGPTPVSALIHAATMVAAGVYLVGRTFPIFTTEVLLTIAYVGGITLFVAATIAVVMTDIKKVLAYSTVSQLGYMMLALGVGGWVSGLFHLITHAFFKALLFLGSGSVIYGCHHEQEMTKMGGLFPKMKITALTMLMGVLAISGVPSFSGWYSKDSILAAAFGYIKVHPEHILLFILPLATAGLTTFYMFRMWFMTFTGKPRDQHVHDHAHESPPMMTIPLILLAFFSVTVAWGWPFFSSHFPFVDAQNSWLEHQLHHAQPAAVNVDFGFNDHDVPTPLPMHRDFNTTERYFTQVYHELAGTLALGSVLIGLVFAFLMYRRKVLDPADAAEQFPGVYRFLQNKWCFDELYSVMLVRPAIIIARWARWFDAKVLDGVLHLSAFVALWTSYFSGGADRRIIDGSVNLVADVCQRVGRSLRSVQTGYIRSYVLFLVLAVIGLYVMLMPLL